MGNRSVAEIARLFFPDMRANSMIEAYTGNRIGHRVSRKHLKVDTAPKELHVEGVSR